MIREKVHSVLTRIPEVVSFKRILRYRLTARLNCAVRTDPVSRCRFRQVRVHSREVVDKGSISRPASS